MECYGIIRLLYYTIQSSGNIAEDETERMEEIKERVK